ncbi:MAG: hypothetical protein AAGU27_21580 [Dehalobacterium sp.]
MSLANKLAEYNRAYITEAELEQMIKEVDYRLFHQAVEKLVEEGVLRPVKSAGNNGRIPSLANKYRIIKSEKDLSEEFDFIRRLHPSLDIAGYLAKPELYQKHREIVEGLSKYLWYEKELLSKPMSRKERSFSVWGREKLLDEHFTLVREVLTFSGLKEDFLAFYDTPEPFFEYVHSRGEEMTVLVLENKDTWFTIRKLFRETGKNIIDGTRINALIYGEGNKISKHGALEAYGWEMLSVKQDRLKYLYFGDLDPEGIRLFFRAQKANPQIAIQPFSQLYGRMLKLALDRELPESKDKRGKATPWAEFIALLGFKEVQVLIDIFAQGKYIPQEIINYQEILSLLS